MSVVIPPKKNRIIQRKYDKDLCKIRHIVENTFLHLKRWRGITTKYAKNSASFLAVIQIIYLRKKNLEQLNLGLSEVRQKKMSRGQRIS